MPRSYAALFTISLGVLLFVLAGYWTENPVGPACTAALAIEPQAGRIPGLASKHSSLFVRSLSLVWRRAWDRVRGAPTLAPGQGEGGISWM